MCLASGCCGSPVDGSYKIIPGYSKQSASKDRTLEDSGFLPPMSPGKGYRNPAMCRASALANHVSRFDAANLSCGPKAITALFQCEFCPVFAGRYGMLG